MPLSSFSNLEVNETNKNFRINSTYIGVSALAVIFSWVFHEFAHWTTGEFLGYEMGMTFNKAYPLSGEYSKGSHYMIISAAGPIVTLIEAVVIYVLMMQRNRIILFPFLLICFYMRLLATVVSLGNPNDEARISSAIGLGKFTLPLIVTACLFNLLYKIAKKYRPGTKFILKTVGLVILFSSIIILADMYFHIRLI